MSRGRKPKAENTNLNWQEYFKQNVGVYLQSIIIELGQLKTFGNESGRELLQEIKKQKNIKKEVEFPQIRSEDIPFRIPENWVWCRLGEIIEHTDNLNIETKFSKETIINYVDIDAIDNKNYKIRENKLKPVSELSSRARRVLRKGYILYSLVRPYLNNVAIIEKELTNHIGSTGFAVFNGILVNNKYLKYILLSDYVRQLFLSKLSGFNSPTITQDQFNSTPIPLPPISEQNLILEFLSDFENESIEISTTYFNGNIEKKIIALHYSQLKSSELYSELSQQLTQTENLNQAILQEAVQGKLVPQDPKDEPARELLKRIKAEKAKSGKKEKPLPPIKPEEIPFEIPESWVWCRLGEIMNVKSGKRIHASDYEKQGIPFLRSGEIGTLGRGEKLSGQLYISKKKYNDIKSKFGIPKQGDILIACIGGSIGNTWIVDNREFYYKDGNLVLIESIAEVETNFLLTYLKSPFFWKNTILNATDSSYNALTIEKLKDAEFPLPPLPQQKRIVAEIEKQLVKTKQLKKHIITNQEATEQLLKALLHHAFEVEEMEGV